MLGDGCQYLNRLNKVRAQEKGNAGQLQQLEKESEEQLNLRRKLEQLTEQVSTLTGLFTELIVAMKAQPTKGKDKMTSTRE